MILALRRVQNILGVLLIVVMMSPGALMAQAGAADEDLSQADLGTLIQLAREAFEAGDYDTAIRRLLLANRKEPNPRLLLNVARSYGQKGDCVRSLVYYEAYTRHPGAEESFLETAQAELDNADACEGYSDKLSGRLILESEPHGAEVFVNGESVGKTPREVVGYPAGRYQLRFELEGYASAEQPIELQPRRDATVSMAMKPPVEERRSDILVEPNSGADSSTSTVNWAALGLMGAGVAALTTGIVYDLVLIPKTDDERALLNRPAQESEFQTLTDKRETQATIAVVGYVTGGVLLAGGAAWYIYDMMSADGESKDRTIEDRLGWRVLPMVDARTTGFSLIRRF